MTKPLHGLVLRSVLGTGGGAESIILRTSEQIDQSRCTLKICAIRRNDDQEYDFDARCHDLGLDYIELHQKSLMKVDGIPSLIETIKAEKIDFVHAHDYKAVYYARKISKKCKIPTIATLHGWTGHSWKEKFLYYPAERYLLRSFDRILAVSDQLRSRYLQSGGDPQKTFVILNGVDPDAFQKSPSQRSAIRQKLGIADNETLLLGLGRLEPQKRFDVLLDTVKLLNGSSDESKFALVVAGEGSLKSELAQHLKKLGLENSCRFLGHYANVKELFNAADILVQSSDYEGTPTVVVEGMAMELPIVATDVGGTAQLLHNGVHGRVVARRDPDALARAIEDTISEQETTTRYVKAARARVETDLSFAKRTEYLMDHYAQLVN